jgi:phenylacetate-coenzyme A ligase PaaK-like adenylate-forming protein
MHPTQRSKSITTLPTSGTSGTPKRIYFSEEDLELTAEYFEIGMQELMKPREKAAIFMRERLRAA